MAEPRGFESARREAESYAGDRERTARLLGDAEEKAQRDRGRLFRLLGDLQSLLRMLRAWVGGRYTSLPWRTLLFSLAGIIYFVNPFDVFPDFLPALGYLDDAGVLAFVIQAIRKDLEGYLRWERANSAGGDA
jgi:uncharacterized membrane protein YkvA (DUF1232 family)